MVMQKDEKCRLPAECTDMNRSASEDRVKMFFVFRLLTTNARRRYIISAIQSCDVYRGALKL